MNIKYCIHKNNKVYTVKELGCGHFEDPEDRFNGCLRYQLIGGKTNDFFDSLRDAIYRGQVKTERLKETSKIVYLVRDSFTGRVLVNFKKLERYKKDQAKKVPYYQRGFYQLRCWSRNGNGTESLMYQNSGNSYNDLYNDITRTAIEGTWMIYETESMSLLQTISVTAGMNL